MLLAMLKRQLVSNRLYLEPFIAACERRQSKIPVIVSNETTKTLAKVGMSHGKGVLTQEDATVVKTAVNRRQRRWRESMLKDKERGKEKDRISLKVHWLKRMLLLSKPLLMYERDNRGSQCWKNRQGRQKDRISLKVHWLKRTLLLSKPPSINNRDDGGSRCWKNLGVVKKKIGFYWRSIDSRLLKCCQNRGWFMTEMMEGIDAERMRVRKRKKIRFYWRSIDSRLL